MDDKNNQEKIEQFEYSKKKPHQGRNMKWFRKKKGYSQEALAIDIGVTQQTISEWEKLEELPVEQIEKICQALDIGVSWIRDTQADSLDDGRFSQDGNNNNNFQQNETVTFTIHNPLEKLESAYNNTIGIITDTYNDAKGVYITELTKMEDMYTLLRADIKDLKDENKVLRQQQVDFFTKLQDKFFKNNN